jgi:hypothetical protein
VLNDLSVYPFRLKMFASDLVRIRKVWLLFLWIKAKYLNQ